jgi:poly [ADP-ribose] polymerase 7/11/12/13
MNVCVRQVVVGDYARGKSGLTRPPPKDRRRPYDDLYDSCVDNVKNPSIFVTFDLCQSYPEYIIEY